MRVAIVVEKIGNGEAAGNNGLAIDGALTRELIFVARNRLPLRSESEIVGDVQTGYIWFGSRAGNLRHFAVREMRDPGHATEAPATRNFGIEVAW